MPSIALIGPGRHGTAIARLFASHGIDLVLHHHRPEKAEAAARLVRAVASDRVEVTVAPSVTAAVDGQELVVLATLWDGAQRAVIDELGQALVGKVLIDVSNPLDVTPAGVVPRTPREGSAGQFVATLLPAGTGHVKVFSSLATAFIEESADHQPRAVLPFAADSAKTAELVRGYLTLTGWQPWLVGDLSISRELEIGGAFNQSSGRWGRARLDAEEMLAHFGPERTLA